MVQAVANKIFLSYRRDDSSGYTALLHQRLTNHYGPAAVFQDVHSIAPMDRFREVIEQSLSQCAVVLVVMSKQWSRIAGPDGVARLHKPDDVVCWEIENAVAHALPILPILVGGAHMPSAADLPDRIRMLAGINALEMSDSRWPEDFHKLIEAVNRTGQIAGPPVTGVNPFSMRGGIRDDALFYDRNRERGMLRDYLRGKQNCQLVGPRRIGKSSILLFIQRHCTEWSAGARVAYLDLQDPRYYTLAGWLKGIARGFALPQPLNSLSDLMEAIEDLIDRDIHPVLCLDEFGEMSRRTDQFSREVFLTLRACGQRGMSILTAAPKRLSELTDPGDDSSPFFNTFAVLEIDEFSRDDARRYVELERPGVLGFTKQETDRILEFAHGHPLALQSACFHVLAARESGEALPDVLARARVECGLR
jgi:hypothetical protein